MNQIQIGKFISECRQAKKMTQKDLADKLGITDRAISKWENGKCMPDYGILECLCKELDIIISELLKGEKSDYFDDSKKARIIVKIKKGINRGKLKVRKYLDNYQKKITLSLNIIGIIAILFGCYQILYYAAWKYDDYLIQECRTVVFNTQGHAYNSTKYQIKAERMSKDYMQSINAQNGRVKAKYQRFLTVNDGFNYYSQIFYISYEKIYQNNNLINEGYAVYQIKLDYKEKQNKLTVDRAWVDSKDLRKILNDVWLKRIRNRIKNGEYKALEGDIKKVI